MKKYKILILIIFLSPILIFLKLIYPFFKIHFGVLNSDRIGRYVIEYSLSYTINKKKKLNELNLFYLAGKSSNKFFDLIVKRNLIILPLVKYIYIANKFFFFSEKSDFNLKYAITNRDDNGILYNEENILNFKDTENTFCKNFLKKIGFINNKKLVCLIVRDSSYLKNIQPEIDWTYHDHRDSNIKKYKRAIQWLCDNDYFVIRMGKITNNKLNFSNINFFDYSQSNLKNDLLDIWLFANCNLCISTGTGIDFVSLISKKPIFFCEYIPVSYFISFSSSYTLPKKLIWRTNNKELNLKEYIKHNYNNSHLIFKNNILVKGLNSYEILHDLKIYLNIINKKQSQNSLKYNLEFFNMIKKISKNNKYNINFNFLHPNSYISSSWFNRVNK